MKNEIGKNIVKCRKLNGMSQKHLAEIVGISTQGLLKIEKGLVNPKAETLDKIINVLCITPNQLFGLEEITEASGGISYQLRKLREALNDVKLNNG